MALRYKVFTALTFLIAINSLTRKRVNFSAVINSTELRLYSRRRDKAVRFMLTGVPAVIVAIGFAIKTEVYDGRDDDCVFR